MPTLFTVDGDLNAFVGSGAIAGMRGIQVHFEMILEDKGDLLRMTGGPRPVLLASQRPIIGYIRSDGRMYDTEAVSAVPYDLEDPGELGVKLVANAGLSLAGDLYYRVRLVDASVNGFRGFHDSYLLAPTTATTVDLADYTTLPGGVPPVGESAIVPPYIHGGNAFETGEEIVGGGGA